jgi:hypothetical protein
MQLPKRLAVLLPLVFGLAGCSQQNSTRIDYQMGEKITLGPLTYNIVQDAWKTQLGEGFKIRTPQQRFLLVSITATNGGGKQVALPLLTIENSQGQSFSESENAEGVPNPIGILRTVDPAQTLQGTLLFDVALASYKLRLTDGGEPGSEKTAYVEIPLHMDVETGVQPPLPGIKQ